MTVYQLLNYNEVIMCRITITKRQQLIINMLALNERMTLNEIMQKLNKASNDEFDFNVSRSTFCRDVHDIGEIYGVDIEYDSHLKQYYIADDEDVVSPAYNLRLAESNL